MTRTPSLVCLAAALALAPLLDAQAERIKPGKWTERNDVPEGWVLYESRHYQIQSECGLDKAKRLANHMETMFRVYVTCFPPGKSGFIKKPIKLFKDRKGFLQYGGNPGAAAYYTYGAREMVCYDTGRWMDEEAADGPTTGGGGGKKSRREIMDELLKRSQMDLLGVMAHEGWHQYFHWYVVSMVQLPSWINEGMGDYFYAARPIEGADGGLPVELGRMNEERLPIMRVAVKRQRHVPIKEIIRYNQAQYYANPGICYAEGWALCQFLLHHEKKRYRMVVPTFIKLVKNDTNMADVTDKAFRGIDLDELDREFQEWVLKQQLSREEQLEKALEDAEDEEEGSPVEVGDEIPPEIRKAIQEAIEAARKRAEAEAEGSGDSGGDTPPEK